MHTIVTNGYLQHIPFLVSFVHNTKLYKWLPTTHQEGCGRDGQDREKDDHNYQRSRAAIFLNVRVFCIEGKKVVYLYVMWRK